MADGHGWGALPGLVEVVPPRPKIGKPQAKPVLCRCIPGSGGRFF